MIIIINGSINAGKTTVAKILAQLLSKTAHVEIDTLREFYEWMSIKEAVPISLELGVNATRILHNRGLNVIITYPFSKKNYDYFVETLNLPNELIYFVTLRPQIEKAVTNRGTRELTGTEKDRIKYHYDIGINNHDFGLTIDNSDQLPSETAHHILNYIGSHS